MSVKSPQQFYAKKNKEGRIVIKKQLSILDLAGSGASKASVEEVNQLIDEMRSQDA